MGNDEAALVRLWHEKHGETEPEDLSGDPIVQLGVVTEAAQPALVRAQHRANRRMRSTSAPASRAPLDGGDP